MAKFPFTDKDGQVFYYNPDSVEKGERSYVIVKKQNQVLCMRDESAFMYTLPQKNEAEINAKPTGAFETIAYVIRQDVPVRELQKYEVYEVSSVDLADTLLEWVDVADILLREVNFDATQKSGMKNLLVRGK